VNKKGLAALLFLYVVWGSGFLAIRLAVTGEGAFAPYTLAGLRTFAAGILLFGLALAKGDSWRMSARAFVWLLLTGVLFWVGGHTLIIWAERRLDSGLAALIFASSPLWAALFEGFRGRAVRWAPLVVGFVGVALVLPLSGGSGPTLWLDGAIVMLAAIFWALATVLGDGPAAGVPLAVSTGVQLAAAGIFNLAWALLAREPWVSPNVRAWGAFVFLTVVDTMLAFLAYAYAQKRLSVGWLMSFAYVNPVVAVVLGGCVLGEQLTLRAACGMAVVVASVAWLFRGEVPA
jgi:drug/metabolite transporter (DMT)-like permease